MNLISITYLNFSEIRYFEWHCWLTDPKEQCWEHHSEKRKRGIPGDEERTNNSSNNQLHFKAEWENLIYKSVCYMPYFFFFFESGKQNTILLSLDLMQKWHDRWPGNELGDIIGHISLVIRHTAFCSLPYLELIQHTMGFRKHSNDMMCASGTKTISKTSHHTNLRATYVTASWLCVGYFIS